MKCLVAVKRVVDPYSNIRVKKDNSAVDLDNVKMVMNPFDEIAVEEAVSLKEKGSLQEVLAVSIGSDENKDILQQALARGADKALLIKTTKELMPLNIAKVLQKLVYQEDIDIVFLGKQAIDNDCNQVGQMLSALLDWSQGTFISKVMIDEKQVIIDREVDQGIERLQLDLPAVLTTDLRLNEPRYISLPNIIKAKKKPLEEKDLSLMDIKLTQTIHTIKVVEPEQKKSGELLKTVDELVDKLKNEAKVL